MQLLFLGGVSTTEVLIIMVVALLVFGGRLPEVARSLGKSLTEFRRGVRDLTDDIERETDFTPPREPPRGSQVRKNLTDAEIAREKVSDSESPEKSTANADAVEDPISAPDPDQSPKS